MPICIVGSVAVEDIKTPHGQVSSVLGGSGVYATLAASFFSEAGLVSVVGEDFPSEHLEKLKEHGIEITGVEVKPGKTFHLSTEYGADMAHPVRRDFQLNVFRDFRPAVPPLYENCKYIFLANCAPTAQRHLISGMENPLVVMADTVDYWIETQREILLQVLERVDILLINHFEAERLTGQSEIVTAARMLHSFGPRYVIIKQGADGSTISYERAIHTIPAYPSPHVKDPTGAGDSYAGGLMGYLSTTESVDVEHVMTGMLYGTVIASQCVSEFGVDGLLNDSIERIEERKLEFESMLR